MRKKYKEFKYTKMSHLECCTKRYDKPFNVERFIAFNKIERTTQLANMLFDLNTVKRTIKYAEETRLNSKRSEDINLSEIHLLEFHGKLHLPDIEEHCRIARLIIKGKYTGKVNKLKLYWYKLKDKFTSRNTMSYG